MARRPNHKLFVNLPVADLQRSVEFFTHLGMAFNEAYADEHTALMELSTEAFVMLQSREKFARSTSRPVSTADIDTEVILSITVGKRSEVDEMVSAALVAGGSPSLDPVDNEVMYGWGFHDPDGHVWQVLWMAPEATI